VGKSAQLPLQTWLADAMAGPTPVSALIHAATMVTAGVYLIARTHGLFLLTPEVCTGRACRRVTLVLAGFAALVQTDIKRVLAYSTMSQIGYMFLALGVRRLGRGDLPPDDARVLQGAAVPRFRCGDSSPATTSRTSSRWAACGRNCRWPTPASWSGGARWQPCRLVTAGFYSKGRNPLGSLCQPVTSEPALRRLVAVRS
jgi:hypothetical protein